MWISSDLQQGAAQPDREREGTERTGGDRTSRTGKAGRQFGGQFGDKARTRIGKVPARRCSMWGGATQRFRCATSSIFGTPVTESSSHRINNLRRKRPITSDPYVTLRPESGGAWQPRDDIFWGKPCQTVPKGRPAAAGQQRGCRGDGCGGSRHQAPVVFTRLGVD